MKRRYSRLLAFVCSLLLCFSFGVTILAVEPRATNYIAVQSSGLTRTTGTDFRISYSVTTGQTVDQVGVFMIQLMRSTDQQTWYREEVFYSYDYPELLCENSWTHSGSITYTGTRGYYYRANVVFYAKEGTDSERTSMYTNVIYIPQSGNGGRVAE